MMVKSTLKRFGFIKPSSEFYDGEKLLQQATRYFLLIKILLQNYLLISRNISLSGCVDRT